MGIRKSTGKNKKMKRRARAAGVEQAVVRRRAAVDAAKPRSRAAKTQAG